MSGVPQGASNDLGSPVMTVKSRFGDNDANWLVHVTCTGPILSKTLCGSLAATNLNEKNLILRFMQRATNKCGVGQDGIGEVDVWYR